MQPVTAVCKRLCSIGAIALCLGVFGCVPGSDASVDAVAFAKKTLSESYAAKAELGEVLEVIHQSQWRARRDALVGRWPANTVVHSVSRRVVQVRFGVMIEGSFPA
jgi:hypothetical protein